MKTAETATMSTNELEAYLDQRYEAGAPQAELEALETAFAERVSEDDLQMTEDEPAMREAWDMGVDLEEWLAYEYWQYLNPNERGGRDPEDFFQPETFNDFLSLNLKPSTTRKQILSAAKDAYLYKTKLIQRQKSNLKFSNIPPKYKVILDKNGIGKYDIK